MSSILVAPPIPAESIINGLNPQEAVHDTPNFRSNVKKFEEQIDHFEKWLDALFKAVKSYSEELIKFNEANNNLARKATLTSSEESMLDRDFTLTAARIFADTLQTTYAFKAKLSNDIDEKLLQPVTHFMKNDLKEFKEARRNYERTLEKYESMLAKYTSQSKNKEASALREDAFQLFEVRKNYIRTALDYTLKIIQFRASIDHLIMEQFLAGTITHLDMHEASRTVYKESENRLERLKGWLSESKKTCENQNPLLQDLRKKLEEEAISSNRPRRKLTKYTDNGVNQLTFHPNSDALQTTRLPSSASLPSETPSKQGYLFMRSNGKNAWSRKYFYLKDGIFWWASVGQGKHRSTIEESEKIGVLLCEVRADTSQDRRFCFEVVCGAKQITYILQAETESELREWITVFENAKTYACRSPNDLSSPAAAVVTTNKEIEDERNISTIDEEHNPNTPSVEGYKINDNSTSDSKITHPLAAISPPSSNSLTKKRATSVSIQPSPRPPLVPTHQSYSTSSKGPTTTLAPINNNSNIITSSSSAVQSSNEKSSTSANQQNFWGTLQWAMPAMNLIMNTANTSEGDGEAAISIDGRLRSECVPVGSGADGSIAEYPHNLLLHNAQLHLLFPFAAEAEFVLDIFNCAWYKDDMSFKGRAYITQEKLYFYSIVMSIVNMFWISWRDVKSIAYKSTDTQQIIELIDKTNNQTYVIKTYLDIEGVFDKKARTVWRLATGEKPVALQNIFNAVWNSESEPKTEGKKNDTVSKESTEQKNGSTYEIEKPLEKVEGAMDPKKFNSEDHKDHVVNDVHEKDNKITDNSRTLRTPGMIIISPSEDDLPSNISQPTGPVECYCPDHLEKIEAENEFPVSARKLFDMIFDEKSTIWSRLHKKKGNTLLHSGPWVIDTNGDGERKREFKYIMPLNNPITKIKESECIETQICKKRDDYLRYSVLSHTKALQTPYNDSFLPMTKYCITYVSKTSCKLTCYIGIKWFKSPMVKSIIRKAAMTGLAETVTDLMTLVKADVAQRKSLDPSSPRPHSASPLRRRPHSHRLHKSRESQSAGTSKVLASPTNEPKFKASNLSIIKNFIESILNFAGNITKLSSNGTLGIILALSLIFNIYLFIGVEYNAIVPPIGTALKTDINLPAVYIRDLEEHVLNTTSSKGLKGVDLTSYRQFLDTRIVYPPYPWLLHSHRRMSDEISFARKKVAVLRYDLLLTFRLINSIDRKLLESEYVNWLLDERAKCNKARWMLLKDDLFSEEQKNNLSTVGNENDDISPHDSEKHKSKHKSEYKSIIKYCGDVKRKLDVFSKKF